MAKITVYEGAPSGHGLVWCNRLWPLKKAGLHIADPVIILCTAEDRAGRFRLLILRDHNSSISIYQDVASPGGQHWHISLAHNPWQWPPTDRMRRARLHTVRLCSPASGLLLLDVQPVNIGQATCDIKGGHEPLITELGPEQEVHP